MRINSNGGTATVPPEELSRAETIESVVLISLYAPMTENPEKVTSSLPPRLFSAFLLCSTILVNVATGYNTVSQNDYITLRARIMHELFADFHMRFSESY